MSEDTKKEKRKKVFRDEGMKGETFLSIDLASGRSISVPYIAIEYMDFLPEQLFIYTGFMEIVISVLDKDIDPQDWQMPLHALDMIRIKEVEGLTKIEVNRQQNDKVEMTSLNAIDSY
jgi:hypothetical protein